MNLINKEINLKMNFDITIGTKICSHKVHQMKTKYELNISIKLVIKLKKNMLVTSHY